MPGMFDNFVKAVVKILPKPKPIPPFKLPEITIGPIKVPEVKIDLGPLNPLAKKTKELKDNVDRELTDRHNDVRRELTDWKGDADSTLTIAKNDFDRELTNAQESITRVFNACKESKSLLRTAFLYAATLYGGPYGAALANAIMDKLENPGMSEEDFFRAWATGAFAAYAGGAISAVTDSQLVANIASNVGNDIGGVIFNGESMDAGDLLGNIISGAIIIKSGDSFGNKILDNAFINIACDHELSSLAHVEFLLENIFSDVDVATNIFQHIINHDPYLMQYGSIFDLVSLIDLISVSFSCSKSIDFNISKIASAPIPAVNDSSPNSS